MPGLTTHYSPACITLIKQWQGLSLEKYKDAQGRWVIGYGHEITQGDNAGEIISPAQAEAYLLADLQACEEKLADCQLDIADRFQLEALLVLIFSQGINRFLRTGALPVINMKTISQPENI